MEWIGVYLGLSVRFEDQYDEYDDDDDDDDDNDDDDDGLHRYFHKNKCWSFCEEFKVAFKFISEK